RNEMQRLLRPKLLLDRAHIRDVAGKPVVELYFEFCFERFRIHARTYSSNKVQEIAARSLETRHVTVNQYFRRQRKPKVRHAGPRKLRPIESGRRHTDYGEWMTVDLIGSADHAWVGAVFLVPDPVAHHRNRRRTFHIVLIGHQPADPGLHPKGPEEIA